MKPSFDVLSIAHQFDAWEINESQFCGSLSISLHASSHEHDLAPQCSSKISKALQACKMRGKTRSNNGASIIICLEQRLSQHLARNFLAGSFHSCRTIQGVNDEGKNFFVCKAVQRLVIRGLSQHRMIIKFKICSIHHCSFWGVQHHNG